MVNHIFIVVLGVGVLFASCKVRTNQTSDVSNNGRIADRSEEGASVRIAVRINESKKGLGSGSIIQSFPPRVLTAAHNVVDDSFNTVDPKKVEVFINDKWQTVEHIDVNEKYLDKIKVLKKFSANKLANVDEAVLTLNPSVAVKDVYVISKTSPKPGDKIIYKTFGDISPIHPNNVYFKDLVPMRIGENYISNINENCAMEAKGPLTDVSPPGEATTAVGDSGGTILNAQNELIGVVSGGGKKGMRESLCVDNDITEAESSDFIQSVFAPCVCARHDGWCMIYRPGAKHALEGEESSFCSLDYCKKRFPKSYRLACGEKLKALD